MKTLRVSNGIVNGQVKNILGKDVVEFLSIPFCKPPINERRLRKPEPCEGFSNEVINKMSFETCPPQVILPFFAEHKDFQVWTPKEKQSEDCLYVNIWCPLGILEGKEKRPVLIWIYGGAFVSGSSSLDIYRGDVLASHENIIVVSFNYRLGALGFLCLDEFGINGNQGIWDQILAMKWIHENISVFNGDPNNTTLMGCSTGGLSVSLHMLIEESWPYFQKAIVESGTCLSDWAFRSKEDSVKQSIQIVNDILDSLKFPLKWNENLSKTDKEKIITYLYGLDFNEFVVQFEIMKGFGQLMLPPRLDGELFKEDPKTLVKEGRFKKCPTVVLTAENEASILLSFLSLEMKSDISDIIEKRFFDKIFDYFPFSPFKCSESTKSKIKQKYGVDNETLTIDVLDMIVSDHKIVNDSIDFAAALSRSNGNVYYICFRSFIPLSFISTSRGAHHGCEVPLVFGIPLKDSSTTDRTLVDISEAVMVQFGKFFRDGRFGDDLSNFDESNKYYIDIFGTDWQRKTFSHDQMDKVKFWRNLREEILKK